MDPKICKWVRWLDRIEEELTLLVWSKSIYLELHEIIAKNPQIDHGNRFWDWISKNYVESSLMGIRRQIDKDPQTISLFNLIRDIEENSTLLTREFHNSLYGADWKSYSDELFGKLAGTDSDPLFTSLCQTRQVLFREPSRAIYELY